MLFRIDKFRDKVLYDIDSLIAELQFLTGRYGEEERKAWAVSLQRVAKALSARSFDPLHLYFGSQGRLSLEYQLPASASWCDMVLLGRHRDQPSAVIVELKNWQTRADKPGPVEGLMIRQGVPTLHPSDQVRGYTEYSRRFHSAVYDHGARVHGCVIFTNENFIGEYEQAPNTKLAEQFPCFTLSPRDVEVSLPGYFSARLTQSDEVFATAFEEGEYRQQRGFVSQIGQQILDPENSPFELLDNQRRAFALAKAHISFALFHETGRPSKHVIIIEGPPGSGKSVIAAKLWATLVTDKNLVDGSVVFTTTSASQNSNWSHLFVEAARDHAGLGVVKKATGYTPITPNRFSQLQAKHPGAFSDSQHWQDNLTRLRALGEQFRDGARDEQYLVSIVDEAHALINPEHSDGVGVFGFVGNLGPQAYHIIRTSTITVFLMDSKQGFRDRENTTTADIRDWAKLLGADVLEPVNLEGAQFRCGGSKEYVDWLESVLAGNDAAANRGLAMTWFQSRYRATSEHAAKIPRVADPRPSPADSRPTGLDFRVFESPADMETALRERLREGRTARILSSYSREWKTRDATDPHSLPPSMVDFCESCTSSDGQVRLWSRVWNYVPGGDYTHYVQAVPGSRMHEDPLCEVGCTYAVRGFDFDYVGVLWLEDLVWRNGRWTVDKNSVYESGNKKTLDRARDEQDPNGPANRQLLTAVQRSYRVLMTRALKGVYLWCADKETRTFIAQSLTQGQAN